MSEGVTATVSSLPPPYGDRAVGWGAGRRPPLDEVLADLVVLVDGRSRRDGTIDAHGGLVDALGCGCLQLSQAGVVRAANPVAVAILAARSTEAVVGRSVFDVVEPTDHAVVRELLDGRPADVHPPVPIALGTGGDRDCVDIVSARLSSGDHLLLFRAHDLDRVREDGAAHRRLWRHLPAVAYSCLPDALWTCELVTPSVKDLLGYTEDHWVHDPRLWLERVHPDDRERLLVERLEAMSGARRFAIDYRIRDSRDDVRWVRDEAQLEVRGDQVVRIHGVLVDVTSHHRSEEVLERLGEVVRLEAKQYRQREQDRATLLRVLAHDARSPLVGAVGSLSAALRDDVPFDPHLLRDLLQRANDDLGRLAELLDAVLACEHALERGAVVCPRPVQLGRLVERLVATTAPASHRVVVEGELTVTVDAFIVERAVTNLLQNAFAHTPPGTTVRVQLVRSTEPVGVIVAVDDDGPGVSEEHRATVFEPFVRATGDGGGAGLGLTLVRDLVAMHGGRAWVEDGPGGGASFRLYLPEGDGPRSL